jgi:hypothetical protein
MHKAMILCHFDPDIQVRQTFCRAVHQKDDLLRGADPWGCLNIGRLISSLQAGKSAPSLSLLRLPKEEHGLCSTWYNSRGSNAPAFLLRSDVFHR